MLSDETYEIVWDESMRGKRSRVDGGVFMDIARFGAARKDPNLSNTPDNIVMRIRVNVELRDDPMLFDLRRGLPSKMLHEARHAGEYDDGEESVLAPKGEDDVPKRQWYGSSDAHDEVRAYKTEQTIYGKYRGEKIDVQYGLRRNPWLHKGDRRRDVKLSERLRHSVVSKVTGKVLHTLGEFYLDAIRGLRGRAIPPGTPLVKGWRKAHEEGRRLK